MFAVKFMSFHIILGIGPKYFWVEAALHLYEKEAGPHPEKVCHFCYLEKHGI